ncbi:hypothetical protein I3F58_07315 [Streptomyces sp. MUM 203J]|uniref:hypothetical protein n=1 Tax=Streptomyces sp. MUM 203J TaxID=2791990 RepID=UPI001F04681E|nr:hypothetical protein [Streptomyces sp. MUM 203J]MCH0539372.1 hypothetical protein [Streptomyces sp. MUM 203J]
MADERYGWLDHEAAERLLRGESVVATDDYTRLQTERLAEALDGVRADSLTAAGPAGELPGEEDALVAFRAARAAKAAGPAGAEASVSASGSRAGRWLRPARWGLVASVAGLAVGGVAVAAGTGVLPALGGDPRPEPTPAASASLTPGHRIAEEPAVRPPGWVTPPVPQSPGTSPSPGVTSPSPGETPGRGMVTEPGGASADNDGGTRTDRPGDPDGSGDHAGDRDGADRTPGATLPDRTAQACRDFRDGHLDEVRRRQLESAARTDGGVQRYCDQVLGAGRQSGGTGADKSAGAGDRDGDGDGDGEGEGAQGRRPAPRDPVKPTPGRGARP